MCIDLLENGFHGLQKHDSLPIGSDKFSKACRLSGTVMIRWQIGLGHWCMPKDGLQMDLRPLVVCESAVGS